MPETDKYYRLVTFIINTCASVLRELFYDQASKDAPKSFISVQTYIGTKQSDIYNLKKKKIISKTQYDMLFPPAATAAAATVNENNWDISLLSALITNLYPTLAPAVIADVQAIRNIRNEMQHIAHTACISDSDFEINWKALKVRCLSIALFTKGKAFEEKIENEIEASLTNSMPNLGNSLRQWYTREFAESLYKRIDELSENIKELRKDASMTAETLTAVAIKRPLVTGSGKSNKRVKAEMYISEKPFHDFGRFMTTVLSTNFQPPVNFKEIMNKIRTNRVAVITGYGGSHYYLQTTAHVIRELKLNEKLCILITDPADWKHIDQEEVHLVLFKCPFGETGPKEDKARVMIDIMEVIEQMLKDDKCNLYVVVVSQIEVLREALKHIGKSHELLEDTVTIHKENSEHDPDIIDQGSRSSDIDKGPNFTLNYVELTAAYKTRLLCIDPVSQAVVEAKTQMKSSKVVLLRGDTQHELTQVGLSLATSYGLEPSQFLILRRSEDLVNIQLKNISLLMIENLAGKYEYDKDRASRWLESLEMLLSLVAQHKLNIIVSIESEKFTRCIKDFGNEHEIFSYIVEVNPAKIQYIKSDHKASQTPESNRYCHAMHQRDRNPVTDLPSLTYMVDMKAFSEDEVDEECDIQDITIVEERLMVVTDWGSKCLRCFDLDIGKQVRRYNTESHPCGITTLPGSCVAVTLENDEIYFVKVSLSAQMSFQRRLNGGDGCFGIVYSDNKLVVSYIRPHGKVQILDMDGNILKVFEKNDNGKQLFINPCGLAVSPDNSIIYVSDREKYTVTALSQDGHVLGVVKDHGNLRFPTTVTVDNAGRMYVCGTGSDTVCMVSTETGTVTKLLGKENGLSEPRSIAVCDKRRRMYIAQNASRLIRVYNIE